MAKPVGGLLAFDARGSIGKTIVYSSWRGRNYVRRWVVPGNPRTVDQQAQRALFSWATAVWKQMPVAAQTPWFAAAKGRPVTDRNLFNQINLKALFEQTDLTGFKFSNGALGGIILENVVASPAVDSLSIAYDVPVAPTGWVIAGVAGAVILAQNPYVDFDYQSFSATDMTATSPLVIPGLTTGDDYVGGVWAIWTKPNGDLAYSPQVPIAGTPS